MTIFRYLHPNRWKHEASLYHFSWWLIFLILFVHAWMFPGAASSLFSGKPYPVPLPWILTLPVLFFCVAVVYRYGRDKKRQLLKQGDTVVKQALALQQAQAKIDYLLRIIHDLRSPLTTILNALPLVEPIQVNFMQSIKSAADYAVSLASKAFRSTDVATLEKVRPEPLLLLGWLTEVLNMQKPAANQRGIILKGNIGEDLPDYLLADREVLTRMVVNLIDNAISYSPGNKDVSIDCYQENFALVIKVTNETTGPLPTNPFLPYVRGTENGDGMGLGLTITRRLAETMGGAAYCETKEEGSVSFFVRFPLKPAAAPLGDQRYEEVVIAESKGHQLHILLIEDDENLRAVLSENLITAGIATKVISVGNGDQGIAHATISIPDVIITDDFLPFMDGLEVVQCLRKFPRTKGIPVIVVSGDDLPMLRKEKYTDLGVKEFLRKPFNFNALGRAIRREVQQ